jgi:kynureninase
MPALRERSIRLTAFLEGLLDAARLPAEIVTPRDPARRGAQLSLRIPNGGAGALARRMRAEHGVIADFRAPHHNPLAPVPLYCTYHDCWRAAHALAAVVDPGHER